MIQPALVASFRRDVLRGLHQEQDAYCMALYHAAAVLDTTTTAYTPDGEVEGLGYVAGGQLLTGYRVGLDGDVVTLDWDPPVWTPATIAADGFLIYNRSLPGLDAVVVGAFGRTYRSTNGPFTALLPPSGALTSLIQWAQSASPL